MSGTKQKSFWNWKFRCQIIWTESCFRMHLFCNCVYDGRTSLWGKTTGAKSWVTTERFSVIQPLSLHTHTHCHPFPYPLLSSLSFINTSWQWLLAIKMWLAFPEQCHYIGRFVFLLSDQQPTAQHLGLIMSILTAARLNTFVPDRTVEVDREAGGRREWDLDTCYIQTHILIQWAQQFIYVRWWALLTWPQL